MKLLNYQIVEFEISVLSNFKNLRLPNINVCTRSLPFCFNMFSFRFLRLSRFILLSKKGTVKDKMVNPLNANVAPIYRNQSTDLHSTSFDWFLYEGKTGI